MTNPFDWYHSLYYGEKWNLSDFDTKKTTSLDALLKQLFMVAHRTGTMKMKNSLPAFNAAYYVAVCIVNTEGIDETNLDDEIDSAIKTIWQEDYNRHRNNQIIYCPYAELMLIKWMSYAILSLQEKKSEEMIAFLELFRDKLKSIETDDSLINSEEWDALKFLVDLPAMIENWAYRYHTDLRPHALHPQYYTESIWTTSVRHYNMNEWEWQLTFFQTKEEQMAFLDWAKSMSERPQPPIELGNDLPF